MDILIFCFLSRTWTLLVNECENYFSPLFSSLFIEERLGKKYTENRAIPFAESYKETGPAIPVFFILSPGVDPLVDVEALGKKIGFTFDAKNFHNVSLGQGQEIVAENAIELAAKEG